MVIAVTLAGSTSHAVMCQSGAHQIVGRLIGQQGPYGHIYLRLIRLDGMRVMADAVTQTDGQFTFAQIMEGNYIVEVPETPKFEAASITVEIRTVIKGEGASVRVVIPMVPKSTPALAANPGASVPADVDLQVPASARTRYENGVRAEQDGDTGRAVREYREAIRAYPDYYAARMALGRMLRRQKDFHGAIGALEPLRTSAPRHAEPLVEIGIAHLALAERSEAAVVLEQAVALDEQSWAAHLYLGYSLIDVDDVAAEPHFWRALKINAADAAEAHLALARLAHKYGYLKDAVVQLDEYLAAVPNAANAADIRKLREKVAGEAASKPN